MKLYSYFRVLVIVIFIKAVESAIVRVWNRTDVPTSLPVVEYPATVARLGRRIPKEGLKALLVPSWHCGCWDPSWDWWSFVSIPKENHNWTDGWVITIKRYHDVFWIFYWGYCPFADKFLAADWKGFDALIVYNREYNESWDWLNVQMGAKTYSPDYRYNQRVVGVFMRGRDGAALNEHYNYNTGHYVEILERTWTWHESPHNFNMMAALALVLAFIVGVLGFLLRGLSRHVACECVCQCEPSCDNSSGSSRAQSPPELTKKEEKRLEKMQKKKRKQQAKEAKTAKKEKQKKEKVEEKNLSKKEKNMSKKEKNVSKKEKNLSKKQKAFSILKKAAKKAKNVVTAEEEEEEQTEVETAEEDEVEEEDIIKATDLDEKYLAIHVSRKRAGDVPDKTEDGVCEIKIARSHKHGVISNPIV